MEAIHDLKGEVTMILVTHSLKAAGIADHLIRLDHGRVKPENALA